MKRIQYIMLIATLASGMIACKKGKADVTLTGTIHDDTFNTTLENGEVKLYEIPAGGGTGILIGSGTSNSSGQYSFTFPRNQAEGYRLECKKSNYFPISDYINFSDLSIEEDNIQTHNTTAKAWVALRFLNLSPNSSDVLKYVVQTGKTGCEGCAPIGDQYLNGAIDTTLYFLNDGNSGFSYFWVDISNGANGVKSATTTAFDTTELILNY